MEQQLRHITLDCWISMLHSQGWSLHMKSGDGLARYYTHDDYYGTLMVGYDSEGLIQCEISACLPATFIEVKSGKFIVNALSRYSYVTLLASRITHACKQYSIGAP